ncbi:MAG: alpha/beta hydrolase [Planctomycetaceae bacterium]
MKWNSEVFKSARVRLGALFIALAGLGFRYAESWLFDPPEVVQGDAIFGDHWSGIRTSTSVARQQVDPQHSRWRIAVATNRSFGRNHSIVPAGVTRISGQIQNMLQTIPETAFGFGDVTVPLNRARGAFVLDSAEPGHLTLNAVRMTDSGTFYDGVKQMLEASQVPEIMVFVHGFNVTLEQATARAAQLAEDMPFHGVVIVFSWPSAAEKTGYGTDAAVAERYFWNLAEVLAELRGRLSEETRLHLLAHSMGNRVTLRALNALAGNIGPHGEELVLKPANMREQFPAWGTWSTERITSPALASLVLAAPDVEAHRFEHFASSIRHVTRTMVLYASDSDMALEGSLHFNGEGHRAGDSRARVRVDGMKVIHVSGVNRLDPLGHSYYGSNPGVLDQLARLLRPVKVPETVSAAVRLAGTESPAGAVQQ